MTKGGLSGVFATAVPPKLEKQGQSWVKAGGALSKGVAEITEQEDLNLTREEEPHR